MIDDTIIDDTKTETREDWLTAAVTALRVPFTTVGLSLPAIRVACGFPSNAKRSGAIGECWSSSASADRTVEILISPTLDDPRAVLETLVHELVHAAGHMNHGAKFGAACQQVGLTTVASSWKATKGDSTFDGRYQAILAGLGAYPHAKLTMNTKPKQATRLLKACCPSCGYTIRLTSKWAAKGLPTCPCGDQITLDGADGAADDAAERAAWAQLKTLALDDA
jgi:hypothetical protein